MQAGELDNTNAIIWSNRSACCLALQQFVEAEVDARKSVILQPNFVKGFYRLALALIEQQRSAEALPFINEGLILDPTNALLKKLKLRAVDLVRNKTGISKGFLLKAQDAVECREECAPGCSHLSKDKIEGEICQTCAPTKQSGVKKLPTRKKIVKKESDAISAPPPVFSTSEYRMFTELNSLVKKIKSGGIDYGMMGGPNMLRGIFATLLDKSTFASLLFPGSPPDVLEVLPKNLKELLRWEALTLDLPKIAKSASSVMEGVKKRGATAGDNMDASTEAMLTPQIVQEALARELVDAVKKISKILSNFKAKTALQLANANTKQQYFCDEDDEELDDIGHLLDDHEVHTLHTNKCIIQTDLFGNEWNEAILSDVQRFVSAEPMSEMTVWIDEQGSVLPRVAWIEISSTKALYPALSEGIKQLHGIPFELNGEFMHVSCFMFHGFLFILCSIVVLCSVLRLRWLFHYPILIAVIVVGWFVGSMLHRNTGQFSSTLDTNIRVHDASSFPCW